MTRVSIIVPVYNVEEYLKGCLDCLVKQTLTDLEFICINDGSTDSSLEILNEYAKKDGRFIILSQENQGQGVARNNAIQISKGEYIAFLDPDDWVELNALEILYNFAKEKNAQIVQFNYKEYNQYSRVIKNVSFAKKVKKTYNYDLSETPYYNWRNLKKDCLCELDLHVWAHFYNTNFIKNNNIVFAPSKRGEDHLFANGAKLLADKVYYLDEYLYYYRCREGSTVNTKGDDNFCVFDNINKLEFFIKEHNLWELLQDEFKSYKKKVLTWHYEQTPIERIKEYDERCEKMLGTELFKEMLQDAHGRKTLLEYIFSLKNKKENAVKYKILTILGKEFIFRPKANLEMPHKKIQAPLVSIIIPVYNAEKNLYKCLSELVNQTYNNVEIICVDDGSTDSSYALLKQFSDNDTRIKIYSQKNSGPARARNFALNKAKGEFIMFCDADDWYFPDTVEKMITAICNYNCDLVMCDCNIVNLTNNDKIQSDESNNYHKLHLKGFHNINSSNIKDINVVLWNKIFRKDLIKKNNIEYPQKYEQDDLIFVYEYLANTKTFYGLDDILYNYVVGNPNSIMGKVFTQTNTNSKYDFIFAWQHLYDYLKENTCVKNIKDFFIKDNFNKLQHYYSILSEKDKRQAFLYIKEFISNNKCLLENKYFKYIYLINDFENFNKNFYSFDSSLKWYQLLFSIKNSANKTHKIYRIAGLKFSIRRKVK